MAEFWQSITDGVRYRAGFLKASDIVHPVLRVAHRILACTVYSREEPATVNSNELSLLYHMVHETETLPDFGAFVCHKLRQYRTRPGCAIACGGMVTLLSTHPSIPSIPDDMDRIPGESRLGYHQLMNMQMFEEAQERGTFIWKVGNRHRPFLTITRDTRGILSLNRPISDTDWRLRHHRTDQFRIGAHGGQPEPNAPDDDDMDDAPQFPPPPAGPPAGVNPWIYQHITNLEAFATEQRQFNTEQRQFNDEQREHNARYGGVIDNLWAWSQQQPPPPPPGPY